MTNGVVLAHDYATQCGGAERVALTIADAFPGSPMYTTLYDPATTFPQFGRLDLRVGGLNHFATLRHHHRAALPLLAPAVGAQRVVGDVLVASSTGWAHAYRGAEHTVVYCHAPARWLFQEERYLGSHACSGFREGVRRAAARTALAGLSAPLRAWDARAAKRADLYLVNSTVTQRAVAEAYGIEAEVLPPPPALLPVGPEKPVAGIEPGYLLCVARLLPYKNVDAIIEAVNAVPDARLVVVGAGPDQCRLNELAGPRVTMVGKVDDEELRWLYRNSSALVAASYEDFGLSPLEAGGFGRPSLVLRDGGFLDTVTEGVNGVFFDTPTTGAIIDGIEDVLKHPWDPAAIVDHIEPFAAKHFQRRLQEVVRPFIASPSIEAKRTVGAPKVVAAPRRAVAAVS